MMLLSLPDNSHPCAHRLPLPVTLPYHSCCCVIAVQVTVGVMDSGVDSSHPDIYYVGGQTWLTDASDLEGDSVAANVDAYGHGEQGTTANHVTVWIALCNKHPYRTSTVQLI